MQVANGTADVTTYFVLRDATTHAPKADVTITDIDLYYCEQGAAMAAKVDATALAAADSAHGDNQAFHVGQALYRIDWPDAAFNGGVGKVVNLIVVCTGVDTTYLEVELTGVAQTGDSYARLGAPAGASVSADVAALPTATQNADALLARDLGSGTNAGAAQERTVRSALRFLRNKWTVAAGTLTVTTENDTTTAWTAAVTGTAGADPVTGSDPT